MGPLSATCAYYSTTRQEYLFIYCFKFLSQFIHVSLMKCHIKNWRLGMIMKATALLSGFTYNPPNPKPHSKLLVLFPPPRRRNDRMYKQWDAFHQEKQSHSISVMQLLSKQTPSPRGLFIIILGIIQFQIFFNFLDGQFLDISRYLKLFITRSSGIMMISNLTNLTLMFWIFCIIILHLFVVNIAWIANILYLPHKHQYQFWLGLDVISPNCDSYYYQIAFFLAIWLCHLFILKRDCNGCKTDVNNFGSGWGEGPGAYNTEDVVYSIQQWIMNEK